MKPKQKNNSSLKTAWKPKCLDTDPNLSTAARDYRHWRTVLLNYLDDYQDQIPSKYGALLSCVSSGIFEYIEGCTDFDAAIRTLDRLFIKTPNEVFARHLLATRRQKPGELLDEFFGQLEKLKENCNFRDHTAEECGNEAMRDAFIAGVASHAIRQHLLENKTLDLQTAYKQASALDVAQCNNDLYTTSETQMPAIVDPKHSQLQRGLYSCHVSPLPVNIKEYDLRRLFNAYDDLFDVFVSHQKQREHAKYTFGFVRFKSKKSADHAVQYFTKRLNGWPLVVRHAKETTERLAGNTDKSDSRSPCSVLDADFVKVFKQFWQTDSNEESLDSTLKSINKKRVGSFHLQSPISALSVDLTETTTQNIDYKLWRTFFREQNSISKSIMEISRSQGSLDITNPEQSKFTTKEKDPGKEVCDTIKEICPLERQSRLELKGMGRGNLCILDHGSKSDSESRRQSSLKEFFHSESGEGEEHQKYHSNEDQRPESFKDEEEEEAEEEYGISEDQRLESLKDEEARKNRSLLTEDGPKTNAFSPRCYPIGRGMGLAFAYQNINIPNQDGSQDGFYKNNFQFNNCDPRDSIHDTSPKKEDADEFIRSLDVYSDP